MKQNYRNPLGVAFGAACRAERKTQDMSADQLAEQLGIKPSFYKLVENGTNYLHTNKSPAIVNAFNGVMNLDGVSKMLLAISHSEATARSLNSKDDDQEGDNYLKGFHASIEQLSKMDNNKLGRLLLPYQDADIASSLATSPAKAAKDILKQHGLTAQAQEFLKNYDELGLQDSGLQSSALIKKIESVPSMYLDIFSDLANRLGNLPAKVGFEEMWRWEKENQHLFKEWWCIINKVESIVSEDNLQRYHYNHIWNKAFQKSNVLFIEAAPTESLNCEFRTIMKNLLEKSAHGYAAPEVRMANAKTKLKTFSEVIQKVELRSLPENPDQIFLKICDEILPKAYSAFWTFKLVDNSLVGFYAKVTGRDSPVRNMLTEGISLDHKQTASKLDLLQKLWKMSKK